MLAECSQKLDSRLRGNDIYIIYICKYYIFFVIIIRTDCAQIRQINDLAKKSAQILHRTERPLGAQHERGTYELHHR